MFSLSRDLPVLHGNLIMSRAAFALLLWFVAALPLTGQTYSSLVSPNNVSGRLECSGYANYGQSNAKNTIPDFSTCGYRGGGLSIPWIPPVFTLSPELGDNHARIQAAIDAIAAMPIGTDGFRGALLLKAGKQIRPVP